MAVSKSIKETEILAAHYLSRISPRKEGATVIGLSGDLGSGKTAFVKAVARTLGIKHTITSPTFVIEKIYRIPPRKKFSKLVHIDAYRLGSAREFKNIFADDIRNDPKALVFIEWPGNIKGALPKNTKKIKFRFVDEQTREIKISSKFKNQSVKSQ